LVWAALFLWIFLRTGNLILLMVSHAGWDAVAFLSQRWGAVAGIAILVAVVIWIAAPITWLVERNQGGRGPVWYPGQASWAQASPGYSSHGHASMGELTSGAPPGSPAGPGPPPGWQPDPAGRYWWRWWDGQRWTDYVSGP
jgi:hypothetical protein